MYLYKIICIIVVLTITSLCFPQNPIFFSEKSIHDPQDYVINIYDGNLDSSTMRQFNKNIISMNSIYCRSVDAVFGDIILINVPLSFPIKTIAILFTEPLTHEEGHRSILTSLKIGSVSQPFYNSSGAAYVKGVRNFELENLRNTNLPMFIRLHTAGIESDYCIALHENEKIAFQNDYVQNIYFDFLSRTINVTTYIASGLFESLFSDDNISDGNIGKEEENELERDIVGHDVYGMVRHLFRPDMEYKRYTSFNELTEEEEEYTTKVGLRSLLNLLNHNLLLFGYPFQITDKLSLSGSAGHCIAPFGDFIDENIFFKYDKFNISFYARQAQNRNFWFPGFGLGLVEYKPVEWFSATVRGHFWMQPEKLDFNTATGVPGGAGEVSLNFILPNTNDGAVKGMGINIGALYKTKGFMPEIESHDAHFRLSAGLVVRY